MGEGGRRGLNRRRCGGSARFVDLFSSYSDLEENPSCSCVTRGICDTITGGFYRRSAVGGEEIDTTNAPGVFHSVEQILVVVEAAQRRTKKSRTQSIFIENHKESKIFRVSARDACRQNATHNSPYQG